MQALLKESFKSEMLFCYLSRIEFKMLKTITLQKQNIFLNCFILMSTDMFLKTKNFFIRTLIVVGLGNLVVIGVGR